MYGYNGKFLLIDATTQNSSDVYFDEDVLRDYIGGTGLATWLLYKYCPRKVDPFDPENPIIFCTSPLVGTKVTTSSKFAVVSKSPLTGLVGDSMSSSFLATELKATGYDALVIKGSVPVWKFLVITENGVVFENAENLLGLSTIETEDLLKKSYGDDYRVATIGPAGENLVRFATISNDGGRQAGRTGVGAVMGSKKIKALCFKGNLSTNSFNESALSTKRKELSIKSIGNATEKYRVIGTMANTSVFNRLNVLPSSNFRKGKIENIEVFEAESIYQDLEVKQAHCANCTIGCEKIVEIPGSKRDSTRLEYQSVFAMGPLVGSSNRKDMLENVQYCDQMGLDTISAGATVAWYLECKEKELTGEDDINLTTPGVVSSVLKKIVHREGIGDLLAEGVSRASKVLASGTGEKFAMHVKGLEMPGYEPRSLKTMALALAVSTKGACHNRASAYEKDFEEVDNRLDPLVTKGGLVADSEDYSAVMDSLIWCKFIRKVFDDFYEDSAELLNDVTGWDVSASELKKTGERINNIKKLFNIREGWDKSSDTLPHRILNEPLDNGDKLSFEDLEIMISSYYIARGWTKSGRIPESKIRELRLPL